MTSEPASNGEGRPAPPGTVVSTRRGRGHFAAADFGSDAEALQHAYDTMIARPDLPRTLILDAPDRPFALDAPLDVWQSHCRITSTGGVTITPADGYAGPLIASARRAETERGEDQLITNVAMDHLWLDGRIQALGVKLRHIQLSTISDLHVRRTDGPGLWLSDFCIENLFSDLILSDECGSVDRPALLIEPETNEPPEGIETNGNITVNSTRFAGTMIHFPTNAALEIHAGPADVAASRRHRKIQFAGCYFHAHGRQSAPLVTLGEAYELSFVGTQLLAWSYDQPVIRFGRAEARHPTGITTISHCFIGSRGGSRSTGIEVVRPETETPCLAVFGNAFGGPKRTLAHAVDWGAEPEKRASWAGNAVSVSAAPHVGTPPRDAEASPFG